MKKVMVFGVFDGIHEGHRAFFKEAKTHGDYLIAAVAQEHIVEHLKGRLPQINLADRIADLQAEDGVDKVVIGDAELGTYETVKKCRPEVVALGYDQQTLKEDLEGWLKKFDHFDELRAGWKPKIVVMKSYEPNKYKSSLLRK